MDAVPNSTPLPEAAAAAKKPRGNFFLVLVLIAFIALAVAVAAELYFLSTHPDTRCSLVGCKKPEMISLSVEAPKSLNQTRVDEIKSILDRLTPEKKETNFFNQAELTLTVKGVVDTLGPDIIVSPQGEQLVYQLTLLAENREWFRYRFTQKELDLAEVSVVTYGGQVYPATINDLKNGDTVTLRMTNDFLDTSTGDSIHLEILREKF